MGLMNLRRTAFVLLCATCLHCPPSNAQKASSKTKPIPSITAQQVLTWLPEDTETVTVAQGLFTLRDVSLKEEDDNRVMKDWELQETFEWETLGLLGLKERLVLKRLLGRRIILALQGSRNFGPPPGSLGDMSFEGCLVVVFERDLPHAGALFRQVERAAFKKERIEGHSILAFQEEIEEGTWTTFLAHPRPNILLIATNADFLQEVLQRMGGKKGGRALPDSLPEWTYANTRARFWGIRHVQPHTERDGQTIGVTFSFDITKERRSEVTFLSTNQNLFRELQDASADPSEETQGLNIRYRELRPGIVQATFDINKFDPLVYFLFYLSGWLGHGIYL